MDDSTLYKPLTEAELDQLADFLESLPDNAMTLEMLDGFFVALICGPEAVLPSEYLPIVWGKNFNFETNESAADIVTLLMRHWNTIAHTLLHARKGRDYYEPVLMEDDDGIAHAFDWADGFMLGVEMRAESWNPLFDDKENGGLLMPILLLHHGGHPDLDDDPATITHEERQTAIEYMISSLVLIYQYFEPLRRIGTPLVERTLRRDSPKVGRNDPCPCGSGRKYKQCCGKAATTLH